MQATTPMSVGGLTLSCKQTKQKKTKNAGLKALQNSYININVVVDCRNKLEDMSYLQLVQ